MFVVDGRDVKNAIRIYYSCLLLYIVVGFYYDEPYYSIFYIPSGWKRKT
jgi:hypothetical protein